LLIGIGWHVQKLDGEIPRASWDIPLDAFASPEGLEMFR
jgi:5-formyltetrahydrofolate cyclo-ligase